MNTANVVAIGLAASAIAAVGTGIGAVGVFFIRRMSQRLEDAMLSVAAGIMLAASIFSLLMPAIDTAELQYGDREVAVLLGIAGLLLGASAIWVIHRYTPHEHFVLGREGPDTDKLARIWLFVIAITLHNFPEGMAVGVGFAGGDIANGVALMTGIGIQNVPEGLAVAVSLLAIGYSRLQAFTIGAVTGLAEPVGGLIGSVAVSFVTPLIPWALAFAAGAMLYIISDEIIPETHRSGFKTLATFSLLSGFAAMLYLDAALA